MDPMSEIAKRTPRATAPMMPTMNKASAIITFRAWVEPNAFRPRITKMAPIRSRRPPRSPARKYGIQRMRVPISNRSRPVFVRPIWVRRSASIGEASPGVPMYTGTDAGRRRPSVRASGPGPLRVRPAPRRGRRPASAPHLDGPRRLRRGHPRGRDRREGPPDPRKLRPGVPVPRRPDGPAAFPGHRPDAPLRRRLAARVRLSLLRLLGLLAAGRGRPGVLRDVVVDRAHLLGLFLRLLGLDKLHDSLFSEHPVVDPPLPAVVEGRLFPLGREDAGILQHVEGVPVLWLEDVVVDPLGVAEEVEDVLGHRPGLLLLHPRPVDRVLDRPSQVVDRERAGGTSFGLCLNRHDVSGASYAPPWIFKGSAPPLSVDSHGS